jgi:ankyrin repeat protein
MAVTAGNIKAAEILLRHNNALIHYVDQGGSTCLMWASENASSNKNGPAMVELLLRAGANVNGLDINQATAFDRLCATSGNVRAAQLLIRAGAEIRRESSHKHPMTHLMVAAMNGHKELCRELMEKHNCDPRVQNERGWTASHYSDSTENHNVSKMLQERVKLLNEGEAEMVVE